jgi:hypothetical protein
MLFLPIAALFFSLSLVSIVIIIAEEKSLKFWHSTKKPWHILWRLSLWGFIVIDWLYGLYRIIKETIPVDGKTHIETTGVIFYIVASLMTAGFCMMFWLMIFGKRFDWWNSGKRWQRIFIGSAFVTAITLIIITGLLYSN